MSERQELPVVLWRQVWGLSILLAAHSFAWMAYALYQPQLLQALGFVKLSIWLGIVQGMFGAVIEPVVGLLSDRVLRRLGSRLPLITVGVTLAGLIFVTVALLFQVQLTGSVRWLIPALMTLWVVAMIIFRGPVVALLQQTAPLKALPRANTVLAIVFGLVGALEPLLNPGFQRLGSSVTFILGAIALVVGGGCLYLLSPPQTLFPPTQGHRSSIPVSNLIGILCTGFGAGFTANLLLRILPRTLEAHHQGLSSAFVTSAILLVSALSAAPVEFLTRRLGSRRSLLLGMLGATLAIILSVFNLSGVLAVALILLAGTGFGIIFVAQIPYALERLPPDRGGLATGMLFGGIGAATALLSILLLPPTQPGAFQVIGWAIAATAVTSLGTLINSSQPRRRSG